MVDAFFLSCWFSGQTTFLFETWPLLLVGGFNPSENKHVHQQGNLLQMEVKLQNGGETSKWRWASGVTPPLLRKSLSRSKVRPAFLTKRHYGVFKGFGRRFLVAPSPNVCGYNFRMWNSGRCPFTKPVIKLLKYPPWNLLRVAVAKS